MKVNVDEVMRLWLRIWRFIFNGPPRHNTTGVRTKDHRT